MLPYPSVAIDFMGYHHHQHPMHHTSFQEASHQAMALGMGTLGMNMNMGAASSFTHSWLVPHQDLSVVHYNQFTNNQPAKHQPIIDPRHVDFL